MSIQTKRHQLFLYACHHNYRLAPEHYAALQNMTKDEINLVFSQSRRVLKNRLSTVGKMIFLQQKILNKLASRQEINSCRTMLGLDNYLLLKALDLTLINEALDHIYHAIALIHNDSKNLSQILLLLTSTNTDNNDTSITIRRSNILSLFLKKTIFTKY